MSLSLLIGIVLGVWMLLAFMATERQSRLAELESKRQQLESAAEAPESVPVLH